MSFILDALKKSETERQRADTPALYEMKMAPARRGVAVWLIVLAALLVINVVVLSVVLLRGTHGAAPQIDANSPVTPAPAAIPPPLAAPPSPTQMSAAPAPVTQTADAGTGAAAAAADDDTPAAEPPRALPGATGQNGVSRGSGADTVDIPTYEQAASVPGADLPQLKLDLHAYASAPSDRFVFLNMLNLKEGQTSPAGVRVESITPDGAILSWRGTKFFLHSQ
jgi:general secretion pathway protein B